MEPSILISTKKILGLDSDYIAFDLDILTHINSVFSILDQLGIGAEGGYAIEDETAVWEDLALPANQLAMVRTYVFLKVRMLFDPPTTSFMIDALQKQIEEHEWRLNMARELLIPIPTTTTEE